MISIQLRVKRISEHTVGRGPVSTGLGVLIGSASLAPIHRGGYRAPTLQHGNRGRLEENVTRETLLRVGVCITGMLLT